MNMDTKTALVKPVSLKIADDVQVASHLRELLEDADDGFRRVVKVGLYIEWIAANLPHRQLMPWIAQHCPEVTVRTITNWRSLAKNLMEWAGLKLERLSNLPIAGDQILALPPAELPKPLQKAREKMDEALGAAHGAKQLFLFLGFKQGEIDPSTGYPRAKRGRLKGQGGATKEQRARAAAHSEEERLTALKLDMEDFTRWIRENGDDKGVGTARGSVEWTRLKEQVEYLAGYMRRADAAATKGTAR